MESIRKRPLDAARMLNVSIEDVSRCILEGAVEVIDGQVDVAEVGAALDVSYVLGDDPSLEQAKIALILKQIKRNEIAIERENFKLRAERGLVVNLDTVRKERIARIRTVRAAFMSLGRDVASLLHGKQPDEIEAVVNEKVNRIVSMFANGQDVSD